MESYILYAACQDWGFYVNSRFSEDKKNHIFAIYNFFSTEGPVT